MKFLSRRNNNSENNNTWKYAKAGILSSLFEKVCAKKKKEINCLTEMAKKRIEGGGDNKGESRRGIIGFYFTRK